MGSCPRPPPRWHRTTTERLTPWNPHLDIWLTTRSPRTLMTTNTASEVVAAPLPRLRRRPSSPLALRPSCSKPFSAARR